MATLVVRQAQTPTPELLLEDAILLDQLLGRPLLLPVDPSGDGQEVCAQRKVVGQHARMISALTVSSGRRLTDGTVQGAAWRRRAFLQAQVSSATGNNAAVEHEPTKFT